MDLFDLVRTQLDDSTLASLGNTLGESVPGVRDALLGSAVPAALAGLVQRYSGETGGSALLELLRGGGHDGSILANLAGALSGGARTDALLNTGKGLLGSLLGSRADAVAEFAASATGVRRGSAASLLALAVPVILNVMGRQVQTQGLSGSGLATALGAVPAILEKVAAPGLAAALGIANFAALGPQPDATRRGALWPWLLVPAVALSLFFGLRSCQQTATRAGAIPPATLDVPTPTNPTPDAPVAPDAVAPQTTVESSAAPAAAEATAPEPAR
jgi:OmpA-OmpF porin, OOP family